MSRNTLLTAIATPQVMRYLDSERSDAARTQIGALASAVELYAIDVGVYPPNSMGLKALLEAPPQATRRKGSDLRKENGLIDPWGRAYVYRAPAEKRDFEIVTYGRDGNPGGAGEG